MVYSLDLSLARTRSTRATRQPGRGAKRTSVLRWLAIAALAAVVVGGGGLYVTRGHRPTTVDVNSTPSEASSPSPLPDITAFPSTPPRGTAVYQAKLNGSSSDLREEEAKSPGDIKVGRDSIDLTVEPGGTTGARFNMRKVRDYIGELQIAAVPPAGLDFNWMLRESGSDPAADSAVFLNFDLANDQMTIYRVRKDGTQEALAKAVDVSGIHNGTSHVIAVLCKANHYQLFRDGEQVVDATDDSPTALTSALTPRIWADNGGGSVRILAAGFYDLPA